MYSSKQIPDEVFQLSELFKLSVDEVSTVFNKMEKDFDKTFDYFSKRSTNQTQNNTEINTKITTSTQQ